MARRRNPERTPPVCRDPAIINSPAFKRWFGDSVVRYGRWPRIVYHGAPDAAAIYREGFRRSPTRGDVFFATDDYATAATYTDAHRAWDYQNADPGIVPLFLSIQNPLIIDAAGASWRHTAQHIDKARRGGHDGVVIYETRDHYSGSSNRTATPVTVYAWFKPEQAKSAATGEVMQLGVGAVRGEAIRGSGPNRGTFDPDDPLLRNPTRKVRGGWQWGKSGKVYKRKADADRQGRAIMATGWRENPDDPRNMGRSGLCYPWAYHYAWDHRPDAVLQHGLITQPLSDPPRREWHAWVVHDGKIKDWQTMEDRQGGKYSGKGYPIPLWRDLFKPQYVEEYWGGELPDAFDHFGHYGPWHGPESVAQENPAPDIAMLARETAARYRGE